MNDTLRTLKEEYLDEGLEPETVQMKLNIDLEAQVVIDFPHRGIFEIPVAKLEDVTDDRNALDETVLEDGALLVTFQKDNDGAILGEASARLLYDYHIREHDVGEDALVAEYYHLGEEYLNDTQQTAWHLNSAIDRFEQHYLYR
jgi:hypothetical protein